MGKCYEHQTCSGIRLDTFYTEDRGKNDEPAHDGHQSVNGAYIESRTGKVHILITIGSVRCQTTYSHT